MTVTEPLHADVADPEETPPRDDRGWVLDLALALVLTGTVFVVHNVGYMLSHPFWVDEAWVADSTRAPLGLLPWLTSSTPLGWTLLLRLMPAGGGEGLRLLPLLFTALAVFFAYYVGRELPLPRYLGGLLTGTAVLLVPAMLVRDDLKQYTAEACVSVALVLLVARIESRWTRGRLLALVVVASGGLLIANNTVFVGLASVAAVVVAAGVQRNLHRLAESGVALVATAMVTGLLYEVLDRRHVIPGLTAYWDGYYIPRSHGVGAAWSFVHLTLNQLAPYVGSSRTWLVGLLTLAGVIGLLWLRRVAVALVLPFTLVLVMGASADRLYPFGDLRTSTFWLVLVALNIAIAFACLVRLVSDLNRVIGVLVTAALLASAVIVSHSYIRTQPLPGEDVAAQIAYVDSHRLPGDIVIVDYSASWGFAYYEPEVTPHYRHIDYATTGFLPTFPDDPWVVEMPNRNASDVAAALAAAQQRLAAEGTRSTGRIWIIRTHLHPAESEGWQQDLAGKRVTTIPVGPEVLLLYRAGA
jgi:hypothetical protein